MQEFWDGGNYERNNKSHRHYGKYLWNIVNGCKPLYQAFNLNRPRVTFVEIERNTITLNVYGIIPDPIVLIDAGKHLSEKFCRFCAEVEVSIVHELVHSYLDLWD